MTTAHVSVVIDNYNYGRYLGQAIESVLSQDFTGRLEIVVVDDGSTDDSRRVIASFGDRIRHVFQDNQGQATAFNAGFKETLGQFICLLDSDDYWPKDKVRKVVALFEDPSVGVVQHLLQDVDREGAPLPRRMPAWPPTYTIENFLERRTHFTATSGLAFRKSVLDRILPIPKDVFYYLDDLLFVKALLLSRAANLPEVLGYHRIHDRNFCAGGYLDPRKLELDLRMRTLFNSEIDPLLARSGLRRSERFEIEEDLESARRRILLHMHRGERGRAAGEWLGMLQRHGTRRHGLFRIATCSLALLSLPLYMRCYETYSRRP